MTIVHTKTSNELERAGMTCNNVDTFVTRWIQQRTDTKNQTFIGETVCAITLPNRIQYYQ